MCFVREGRVRGCQVAYWVGGPSQNWGLHPEPRRRRRHSRGEKYVLAGGAGQNMIPFSFPACGRGNSARRALPGEGHWTERLVGPLGSFTGCRPDLLGVPCRASPLDGKGLDTLQRISHLQSLPLGSRTVRGTVRLGLGEATINHRWAGAAGSDEGAIWYPTFLCRKKALYRLSPQRGFSIASLGNPVAPSSVTFGDSFPQGEASELCSPTRKSVPNQGTQMGNEIAPPPEQCATNAKTSECQRAGHKKRGGGGHPPATLCVRAFSRESLDPRPVPGGNPRGRVHPATVPTEPPTDDGGPRP